MQTMIVLRYCSSRAKKVGNKSSTPDVRYHVISQPVADKQDRWYEYPLAFIGDTVQFNGLI